MKYLKNRLLGGLLSLACVLSTPCLTVAGHLEFIIIETGDEMLTMQADPVTYSVNSAVMPEYSRSHLEICPRDFRYSFPDRAKVQEAASTIAGTYLSASDLNDNLPDGALYPDIYKAILDAVAKANVVGVAMDNLSDAEFMSYMARYNLREKILMEALMRLGGCDQR